MGYIPEEKNHTRVEFESSVANINTDCSESDNFVAHKSLILTCQINSRTNLSNSGYYSCDVIIFNDAKLSSDEVLVNVQRDWRNIIIGGSVGSGGLLVLLAVVTIISIVIIKRRRPRPPRPQPNPLPNEQQNLIRDNISMWIIII